MERKLPDLRALRQQVQKSENKIRVATPPAPPVKRQLFQFTPTNGKTQKKTGSAYFDQLYSEMDQIDQELRSFNGSKVNDAAAHEQIRTLQAQIAEKEIIIQQCQEDSYRKDGIIQELRIQMKQIQEDSRGVDRNNEIADLNSQIYRLKEELHRIQSNGEHYFMKFQSLEQERDQYYNQLQQKVSQLGEVKNFVEEMGQWQAQAEMYKQKYLDILDASRKFEK